MNNKRLLRTIIVAISLISAFILQDSLLPEHASAAGTAPDVRITARILDVSAGSSTLPRAGIQISPSAVAFPNQIVGTGSSAVVVDIRNFTGSALTLGSYALSGVNTSDFLVQNFPNNAVLQPDEQRSFSVFFVPTAVGGRSASIAFPTSAASDPTVTIPLSGTGVIALPTPTPTPTPFPGGQTAFPYQGKLVESGANVSTPRDIKFKLFDDENDVQIGSDAVFPNVSIRDGIFTVILDFGSAVFTGAPRSLEISVSQPGANAYTALSPRQPITPTPYAVRSLNALNATTATDAQQLGGVPANQYVGTSDPRMSDSRDPTAGSANYVQNQNASPQALANFSIDGTGSANVINSQTRYNIGGSNALSFGNSIEDLYVGGDSPANTGIGQTFVGRFAGFSNTSGGANSFLGSEAGRNNTTGGNNTFVGQFAGLDNIGGNWNTFIGQAAGHHNSTGFSNTFIGQASGTENTSSTHTTLLGANTSTVDGLSYATAVGAGATVTSSNTVALGRTADSIWIPGHLYLNQLGPATATRLCWNSSNYQISTCSTPLAGTSDLTEFNGEQVPTVLVNAIKEQQTLIDAQAKQIEQLKTLVCSMLPTAEVCSKIAPTK
ncbi:MAG TPA: hypothetical protein PKC65_03135 [Pyrinomonadaceae bacterium]|nr:hypothetical protein [Pyrinomonadaceae bacterium]